MEINLDEWVLTGEGAEGQSYSSKKDSSVLLKLYFTGKEGSVVREQQLSKIAAGLGITTPEPGEIVTYKDRKGLIFKKIPGKKSYSRLICDNPERLDEYAEKFAGLCKELHSIPLCVTDGLEDYRDRVQLKSGSLSAPSCYCHGDLHMGNIINDGTKDYFIDLGGLCMGTPDYDLGVLYFVCWYSPGFAMKKVFHMTVSQGRRFWEVFEKAYFGGYPDKEQHLESIRTFAVARLLAICKKAGFPPVISAILTGRLSEYRRYKSKLQE